MFEVLKRQMLHPEMYKNLVIQALQSLPQLPSDATTAERSPGGEHAWAPMVRPGSIHGRCESITLAGKAPPLAAPFILDWILKQIAFLFLVLLIEQTVVVAMSDLCDLCSDSWFHGCLALPQWSQQVLQRDLSHPLYIPVP